MKKLLVFVILLAALAKNPAAAFGFFEFLGERHGYEFLLFSVNFNIPEDNDASFGFDIGLYNFYRESTKTGLGFEFVPLQYHYFIATHILSAATIKMYWNIFDLFTHTKNNFIKSSLLGPFVSITCLTFYLSDNFKFGYPLYTTGMKFSYRIKFNENQMWPVFTIESGLKIFDRSKNFYVSLSTSFSGLFSYGFANSNYIM